MHGRWTIGFAMRSKAGAVDLDALLAVLPGVYPVEVIASINRLAERGVVSGRLRTTLIHSGRFVLGLQAAPYRCSFGLPVPHPLDYDWRFTEQAVNDLLRECRSLGQKMICLGTPTVFVAAGRNRAFADVVLIDKNATTVDRLSVLSPGKVHELDLFTDPLPKLQAEVLVMDPPWYCEHIAAFLWAASRLCPVRGSVLVSLPPRGTRPTIREELRSVFSWAKQLGFVTQRLEENALAYGTPPFERNALRAVGIGLAANDWRRGTLCIFEKVNDKDVPRPRINSTDFENWREASLLGSRFFFRRGTHVGFDDPTLATVVPGDILPSVSRRHRLREYADVWSSGNRVFRCRAPGVLKTIVEALADGHDPSDAVVTSTGYELDSRSKRLVTRAAQTIHHLAAVELDERRFIGNG